MRLSETAPSAPTLQEGVRNYWRLLQIVRPYWKFLMTGLVLGAAVGCVGVVAPYVSRLLIDEAYPARDVMFVNVLVSGLLVMGVTSAVLGSLSSYYTQYVNSRLAQATGLMFFNHLQHLPVGFFESRQVGEVMSRFADVRSALSTLLQLVNTLLFQGVYIVIIPPLLFLLEWRLALVALLTLPCSVGVIAITGRRQRKRWRESAEAHAHLNAFQVEVLSQIHQFKVMGLEQEIYDRSAGHADRALTTHLRAVGVSSLVGGINAVLAAAAATLVALIGWHFVIGGSMTLGSYIAFSAYLGLLTGPIVRTTSLLAAFQQATVQVGRMFEYLDVTPECEPVEVYQRRSERASTLSRSGAPTLEMQSVFFSYDGSSPVLEDINMIFEGGKTTLVMGPSGAGKSTLLRLLMRVESPHKGTIACGGLELSGSDMREYRRMLSVVWQDTRLIRGTLLDNLTLGSTGARMEVVEEAVEVCQLGDLIGTLPKGFDTPVAEWGATLSGGQRQRVCLARALVRNAPILILDEATSNLDAVSEGRILNSLYERGAEQTVILVTHRTATASVADSVYLLDGGRIAASGAHEALLQESRLYRQMHGIVAGAV